MSGSPSSPPAGPLLALTLDTATPIVVAGVASVGPGGGASDVVTLAERRRDAPRGHAEILTTLILECLTDAGIDRGDVDAVVVGCGPGPFTGLRVGMATAAAFGDALDRPVHGVCTLDAMAADARIAEVSGTILVATDARRREIYWARYEPTGRAAGPAVGRPDALLAEGIGRGVDVVVGAPAQTAVFGTTAAYGSAAVRDIAGPSARGLATVAGPALLAGDQPEPLVPLYLRRPDAVERAVSSMGGTK